jgi:hypothetical protein
MLTTIEVFASGTASREALTPEFDLLVNDVVVESYQGVATTEPFTIQYVYETTETVTADQVSIEFTNGTTAPGQFGGTNSLYVDKIIVDGEIFETESPETWVERGYGTGGEGAAGFFQVDSFYGSVGRFRFAQGDRDALTGTRIRIDASGDEGGENLQLQIDGQTVKNFKIGEADRVETFYFVTDEIIHDISRLTIRFTNDLASEGFDRNLTVHSYQAIDLVNYSSSTTDTFRRIARPKFNSVSTYFPLLETEILNSRFEIFARGAADGQGQIEDGLGRGSKLHTFGFFEAVDTDAVKTTIRVDALGSTGEEQFQLYAGKQIIGTFDVSTEEQAFIIEVDRGIALDNLVISFVNDFYDPSTTTDRNLTVNRVQRIFDHGEDSEFRQSFFTDGRGDFDVYNTSAWLDDVGLTSGFGLGGTLVTNGQLDFVFKEFTGSYVPGVIAPGS